MSQTQAPSSLFTNSMDAGNLVVYYTQENFTSFADAKASTKWRKLGILAGDSNLEITGEKLDFFSGVPQRLVQRIQTAQAIRYSGAMAEIRPILMALALGLTRDDLTITTKASSPTPTTVASGSTKTVINVASATGFEKDRVIKVGTGATAQYGIIKSISSNELTLYEALDLDTNPSNGDAVAEVDLTSLDIGATASPAPIALKLTKTIVTGVDAYSIYIPKVQADANFSMAFSDGGGGGGGVNPVSIPFAFDALSDSDVESGKLATIEFSQG